MKLKLKIKRIIAAAMACLMCLTSLQVYAEEETETQEHTDEVQDDVTEQRRVVTNFTMPKNQRATIITPSVDYLNGGQTDEETVRAELDVLFDSLSEIGLNAVYINTVCDGKAYYSTDMNNVDVTDYSAIALEKAYEHNFRAYMVFDMGYALANRDEGA